MQLLTVNYKYSLSMQMGQYYLEGKKLNQVEKNKAAKDGLEIGKDIDKFAEMGWEEMDKTDLELRLKW